MAVGRISDFVGSFGKDVARPSRFQVLIPKFGAGVSQLLSLRCETTDIPGLTYATSELKMGTSPIEKYPYLSTYNEINMTFIVGDDMMEKLIFDQWLNLIFRFLFLSPFVPVNCRA